MGKLYACYRSALREKGDCSKLTQDKKSNSTQCTKIQFIFRENLSQNTNQIFFFVRSEEDRPTFRFLAQELADVLMELKNNNGHRDEHL